ncbi:hypothetical protein A3J44_04225, partial [candidate division WOR-1 bacterium RIFCSPHIGHO2_02_FULL_45_12]
MRILNQSVNLLVSAGVKLPTSRALNTTANRLVALYCKAAHRLGIETNGVGTRRVAARLHLTTKNSGMPINVSSTTRFENLSYPVIETLKGEFAVKPEDSPHDTTRKLIAHQIGLPKIIDWIITNACNFECKVCWGKNIPSARKLTLEEKFEVMRKIRNFGVNMLTFTGGEPLLDPDILAVLRFAKTLGFRVSLFTNGSRLPELLPEIGQYIDFVSLSIDGHDETSNALQRASSSFRTTLTTLQELRKHFPQINIQILTVVSNINREDLPKIAGLIQELPQTINSWKLNIFYPMNGDGKNSKEFLISRDEFEKAIEDIKVRFPGLPISATPEFYEKSYLFIFPDGEVCTVENNRYLFLGNLLREDGDLIVNNQRLVK